MKKKPEPRIRAEKVGVVEVDSGLIWIGDPCYLTKDVPTDTVPMDNWPDFVNRLDNGPLGQHSPGVQFNFPKGHAGLGVTIQRFGGDGCYPVYVLRDRPGQGEVRTVIIDFAGDIEAMEGQA